MARARKLRGVIVGGISVGVLALAAGIWAWQSHTDETATGSPPPAAGPDKVAVAPATQPAGDPSSVQFASRVRRPVDAAPPSTTKSTAWMDSLISGSKTNDSSVLGGPIPTKIDLSAPPTPVSPDAPGFGSK